MRSEGVGGLYRGLGPQIMALFPNWAVSSHVHTAATSLPFAQTSAWQCHALPLNCTSTCLSRSCPQTCSMLRSAEPSAIECRILPSTPMMELMQCSGMILCPAHKAIKPESHKPVASICSNYVARTAVRMCVLPQLCRLQASPLRTKQPLHSASVSRHGSTCCITTHISASALSQM